MIRPQAGHTLAVSSTPRQPDAFAGYRLNEKKAASMGRVCRHLWRIGLMTTLRGMKVNDGDVCLGRVDRVGLAYPSLESG